MGRGVFHAGFIIFTWVLNVNQHALFEDDRATGLRACWHGEELLGQTASITLESHSEEAIVGVQRVAVGGDPEVAEGVEGQVVWAGDRGDLGLIKAAEVGLSCLRIATDQQQVPLELLAGVLIIELQNHAVLVLLDGSPLSDRSIVLALAVRTAVLVVGQCSVDLAGGWVWLNIFWAVHLGGACLVACQAGEDDNFLSGHSVDVGLSGTIGLDRDQLLPFAVAIVCAVFRKLAGLGEVI